MIFLHTIDSRCHSSGNEVVVFCIGTTNQVEATVSECQNNNSSFFDLLSVTLYAINSRITNTNFCLFLSLLCSVRKEKCVSCAEVSNFVFFHSSDVQ